jgi:hypothetical protein
VKFHFFPLVLPLVFVSANTLFAAAVDANGLIRQSVRTRGLQTEMPSEIFKQSVRNLGLQTQMPGQVVESASDPWFNWHLSPDILRFILWGAVILGILVIFWSLRDSLPVFSRSRKIVAPETAPAAATQCSRMNEAQIEADDLAGQGYFSEAMHVLLLKSLDEIRRQLRISFAVSLTSREILRYVQLSDVGRRALAAIIQSVEQAYFGGREVGPQDYSDCRSNFDALKHSLAAAVA